MSQTIVTKRIRIYGIVQGVGFRPTVDRYAHAAGLRGTVANRGSFVEIYAQGTEKAIHAFLTRLKEQPPKRAVILKMDVRDAVKSELENRLLGMQTVDPMRGDTEEGTKGAPADGSGTSGQCPDFRIIESVKTSGEIFISPDIAVCEDCKRELFDPKNRRYLHPFINCTCCGPRLTILDSLPYDRERTSMKRFPMCPECAREYHDPSSRRYDAQPVCCNDCGPEVYLIGEEDVRGPEAIRRARRCIRDGGILAVKGIGGFHFCCDAENEDTVQLLRARKSRPRKPFAVMMRDIETVRRECCVSDTEEEILTGHEKPILLLRKRSGGNIAASVAPDNPYLGVMLPYAPIQLLLFSYDDGLSMPDAFVMTSANVSGAPIVRCDEDAVREIGGMCDEMLSNNRDIRIRADDSVMELYEGQPYMIRRSRGYAPLPFLTSGEASGKVLAMGGELKNTFCLGSGNLFYPSAYIGDLADIRSVRALRESIGRMETLLEMKPEAVVCDLHPKYQSSALAEKLAAEDGIPVIRVQHHYAHVLSCMAEHDAKGPVLGVSYDGTGYGTDGTVWGGEILLADADGFTRKASIQPFLEIGGDSAAREGWRIAASMIYEIALRKTVKSDRHTGEDAMHKAAQKQALSVIDRLNLVDAFSARAQFLLHDRKMNAIMSTSCGRLFDAVSAVLGIRRASSFEGEAATTLMFRAEAARTDRSELERLMDVLHAREKAGRPEAAEAEADRQTDPSEEAGSSVEAAGTGKGEHSTAVRHIRTDLLFELIVEERLKYLVQCPTDEELHRDDDERQMAQMDVLLHTCGDDAGRQDADNAQYGISDENACLLARFFHFALAEQTAEMLTSLREETGVYDAVLTGGVYQNHLLRAYTQKALEKRGFHVMMHSLVPPNDGGICLGQAMYGMRQLENKGRTKECRRKP